MANQPSTVTATAVDDSEAFARCAGENLRGASAESTTTAGVSSLDENSAGMIIDEMASRSIAAALDVVALESSNEGTGRGPQDGGDDAWWVEASPEADDEEAAFASGAGCRFGTPARVDHEVWQSRVLGTLAKSSSEKADGIAKPRPKRMSPASVAKALGCHDVLRQSGNVSLRSSAGSLSSSRMASPKITQLLGGSAKQLRSEGDGQQRNMQKVPSLPTVLASAVPAVGFRLSPGSATTPGRAAAQRCAAQNSRSKVPGLDFEWVKMDYDNDEDTEDEETYLRSCLKPGNSSEQKVPQLDMMPALALQKSGVGAVGVAGKAGGFFTPAGDNTAAARDSPPAPRRGPCSPLLAPSSGSQQDVSSPSWQRPSASPPQPPASGPFAVGGPPNVTWQQTVVAHDRRQDAMTKVDTVGSVVPGGYSAGNLRLPPIGMMPSNSSKGPGATAAARTKSVPNSTPGKATIFTHIHTHHHLHHHVVRPGATASAAVSSIA